MSKGHKQAAQNRINTRRQLTHRKMPNHAVNQGNENGNNRDVIFPPIKLAKFCFLGCSSCEQVPPARMDVR